jgi:hypothetical protein
VAWTGQNVTLALPTVQAKLPTVAATKLQPHREPAPAG